MGRALPERRPHELRDRGRQLTTRLREEITDPAGVEVAVSDQDRCGLVSEPGITLTIVDRQMEEPDVGSPGHRALGSPRACRVARTSLSTCA